MLDIAYTRPRPVLDTAYTLHALHQQDSKLLNKTRGNMAVTDDVMRKVGIQRYTPTWHQVGDILLSISRMSVMLIGYICPEYTRYLEQRIFRLFISYRTQIHYNINAQLKCGILCRLLCSLSHMTYQPSK